MKTELENLLEKHKNEYDLIMPFDYRNEPYFLLDLSENNSEFKNFDITDPYVFDKYINKQILINNKKFAIGKYNENRCIYDHSNLFDSENKRTIHLGIDLWVPTHTEVKTPLDGIVHSFKNNTGIGDYGPTLILKHELDGVEFFTLYGHLSVDSLTDISKKSTFSKGYPIGQVGNYPENGNWAPHLHFEIISDMGENKGDFPGVTSLYDRDKYLEICPDPNLILGIAGLG